MEKLKFDERGLVVAVAQDRLSGRVQMVAWMNQAALEKTLATGLATFFSRSRNTLWQKGETSGHVIHVHQVFIDCDADTILLLCDPVGPSCHTGQPSCFFRRLNEAGDAEDTLADGVPFAMELERIILARTQSSTEKSYTKSLLEGGAPKIGAKLREEAGELAQAIADESSERVASEAADVLYHLLVGLRLRDVSYRKVIEVLAQRSGMSGHAEKANRQG